MPIADRKFKALTRTNVDRAPRRRGVYALYTVDKKLVFLGSAEGKADTIRSRLRAHLEDPSASGTRYKREPAASPQARLKKLLQEHFAEYGKLPALNSAP